jgi:hypothetical protein
MTYFFDTHETVHGVDVHHKGRVYNVVDKSGNHKWYSVEQTSTASNGETIAYSAFADFERGKYLDIPQSDLDRALTRKSK